MSAEKNRISVFLCKIRPTEKRRAAVCRKINKAGYLSLEAIFIDGTHIKANTNLKKAVKKTIPRAAKTYEKQLMKEINEEQNDHGITKSSSVFKW